MKKIKFMKNKKNWNYKKIKKLSQSIVNMRQDLLTEGALKRLSLRAGVPRLSAKSGVGPLRAQISSWLAKICDDAVSIAVGAQKRTLLQRFVVEALRRNGRVVYTDGAPFKGDMQRAKVVRLARELCPDLRGLRLSAKAVNTLHAALEGQVLKILEHARQVMVGAGKRTLKAGAVVDQNC